MAEIKGGEKLKAYLADLARKVSSPGTLRVGFLEGATYPNGTPVAMVAAIQNYGAPKVGIPPRPFFSNMVTEKQAEWGPQIAKVLKANGMDAKGALDQMGDVIEGELRQSIIDMNDPALSPVTLLLRARFWTNPEDIKFSDVQQAREDVASGKAADVTAPQSKPLVWTGTMLGSVDHEVK